ncbi:MAG: hypothetical protein IJV05_00135 [Muribaculaceae bacterium]|nr:hypothetical protein [Muribaculaceae bacterium]
MAEARLPMVADFTSKEPSRFAFYKSHEWMDYGCYNMDRWRMNETAGRNVSLKVTYALNFGKKTDRSDVQINPIINSAIMKSL